MATLNSIGNSESSLLLGGKGEDIHIQQNQLGTRERVPCVMAVCKVAGKSVAEE